MTDKPLPDHVTSIHIAVPVERVWNEITKTGAVQRSLYNTVLDCELEPGSTLRYYSPDRSRVFIVGKVVEVVPLKKFAYTYTFTTWKTDKPTLVTWELAEENNGCRVTVTHSDWTTAHEAHKKSGAGWQEILGLLKHELETGDLPMKTKIMYRMMDWFMFAMPKTTKTEYVEKRARD